MNERAKKKTSTQCRLVDNKIDGSYNNNKNEKKEAK